MAKLLTSDLGQIELKGKAITYTIKRRRGRRNIGLIIDAAGLTVRTPLRIAKSEIERVLSENTDWVIRKLDHWQTKLVHQQTWVSGSTLQFMGGTLYLYPMKASDGCSIERQDNRLYIRTTQPEDIAHLKIQVIKWLKQQAQVLLQSRVNTYVAKLGITNPVMRLSNARTYWGLCNGKNRVLLNWRLVQMPLELADYVVAHELAHLIELNHSPNFWRVVASIFPDYKRAKKEVLRLTEVYLAL